MQDLTYPQNIRTKFLFCIPTQGRRCGSKAEEIAQRGASQFMLSLEYRNKKCLLSFAWFRNSSAFQTSSSRMLVVNRRCFRAKISRHIFYFLLRCVAGFTSNLSQVRTGFASLLRPYGQNETCIIPPDGFYEIYYFICAMHFSTYSDFGWNRTNHNKHFAWSHT